MSWNEDQCLDIAPDQHATPINIYVIYDSCAEELSCPAIYYCVHRQFNLDVRVTPYMMATSEIRKSDRILEKHKENNPQYPAIPAYSDDHHR
jgi:hypothetical protein